MTIALEKFIIYNLNSVSIFVDNNKHKIYYNSINTLKLTL
jgi:LEA14-like dessication related protein